MISGVFESPNEEFEQIQYIYEKIKMGLPEQWDTFEKFCGCLVYGGLTAYCKELQKMGVL